MQRPGVQPTMPDHQLPAWEYCELRQEIAQGVMHRQYIVFYRVGSSSEEVTVTNRESAIAQLGLEGWEMISTTGSFTQDSSGFRVFFKRPLMTGDDEAG
jgi:hypothetical protein